MKIGRNDPCPCGSGKKYKKCCLNHLSSPQEAIPQDVLEQIKKFERETKERIEKYGHIRQGIGITFKGYRMVAVGSKMFHSKEWRFMTDFLMDYLVMTLGEDWGKAELQKPESEQHPIVQWRRKALEFMHKQEKDKDGVFYAIPTGFMNAVLCFAYDLYTVEDNGRLDDELLRRLKHRDSFQGARHELFAEATMLRAGYTIEHEDERDGSKKHVEFVATHKKSKQKVDVEAKSKHRPGVIAQSGEKQSDDEISLRFGQLINEALKKRADTPIAIFVDTNLPYQVADRIYAPQSKEPFAPPKVLIGALERIRKEHGGKDPFNIVVFSNHPHYYAQEGEQDPRRHQLSVISTVPILQPQNSNAILEIHFATEKYGNIPKELPSN